MKRIVETLSALEMLFAQAPFGFAVLDRELRFVYCNAALAEINGVPSGEHLGRTLADVVPGIAEQAVPIFQRVLDSGIPVLEWPITGTTLAADGETRSWSESIYALRDGDASVGVAAVVIETTDARMAERDRDRALATLKALFENAPLGLGIWDAELRYRQLNEQLAAINGFPVREHLGRQIRDVLPEIGEDVVRIIAGVARSGEAVSGIEVTGRTPRDPKRDRHWRIAYFPIRVDGRAAEVGGIVEEITDEVQARIERERLQDALAAERRLLSDVIARARSGMAVVWGPEHRLGLVNPAFRELTAISEDVEGIRIADVVPRASEVLRLIESVRRGGQPVAGREGAVEARGPEAWQGRRWFRLSLDPVTSADGASGVLITVDEITRQRRETEQLQLGLARERRIAEALQRALLPPRLPRIPGVALAAHYEPAGEGFEVGGDFYDVFQAPDGVWIVALGDVCGKGPNAAAMTATVRHTLRAEAGHSSSPRHLLTYVDRELERNGGWLDQPGGQSLCSAVCVALRPTEGDLSLVLSAAGHPPPVLRRATTCELVDCRGPLLGLGVATYEETEVTLSTGESLLLYSDGVLDAFAPAIQWSPEDLLPIARAAEPDVDALVGALVALTHGDRPARDDVAVLALQRVASHASQIGQPGT